MSAAPPLVSPCAPPGAVSGAECPGVPPWGLEGAERVLQGSVPGWGVGGGFVLCLRPDSWLLLRSSSCASGCTERAVCLF